MVPFTLMANALSRKSSVASEMAPSAAMPAMLHITSSRPNSDTARSTNASTSALLATSARWATAFPPASPMPAATFSAAGTSMSPHTMEAPAAASTWAVARPIPLPAPVTKATRPVRSKAERTSMEAPRSEM
jgi:hypothetical protein